EYESGRQLLAELCGQDEATLVVELLHMSAQEHVVSPLSKPIGSDSNHSTPLPSTYSSALPHWCSNSYVFPGQIGGGKWGFFPIGASQGVSEAGRGGFARRVGPPRRGSAHAPRSARTRRSLGSPSPRWTDVGREVEGPCGGKWGAEWNGCRGGRWGAEWGRCRGGRWGAEWGRCRGGRWGARNLGEPRVAGVPPIGNNGGYVDQPRRNKDQFRDRCAAHRMGPASDLAGAHGHEHGARRQGQIGRAHV